MWRCSHDDTMRGNAKRGCIMGEKSKKDKEKAQKQDTKKQQQKEKKKQEKQPKRTV